MEPFTDIIETTEQLDELYHAPSRLVQAKVRSGIDEGSATFITTAPFLLIGTTGADGRDDVSPRGGPCGFVKVIGDEYVAIPDLNGNNLIDTLRGSSRTGTPGLIFLVPGKDETLRVNGEAWVTTDAPCSTSGTTNSAAPTSAIVVRADEVFVHCAKAFRRSKVWDPDHWSQYEGAPDCADILSRQGLTRRVRASVIRAGLEEDYERRARLRPPGARHHVTDGHDRPAGAGDAAPDHWFEPVADHLGAAYLRYAFTKGTRQEVDHVVASLGLRPGDRVLDVGCGPGRHSA